MDLRNFLQQKRNVINLLVFGILILGLPVAINLVQNQRIFFSRAAGNEISFIATDTLKQLSGKWVTTKPTVSFNLVSPFGGEPTASNPPANYPTPNQSYATPAVAQPTACPANTFATGPNGECITNANACDQRGAGTPPPTFGDNGVNWGIVPPQNGVGGFYYPCNLGQACGFIYAAFVSCDNAGSFADQVRQFIKNEGYTCWLEKQTCGERDFIK